LYCARVSTEYFVERGSTVNLCAIDMQKAFDKMNNYALLLKLMNNYCPIALIKILDCGYSKVFAMVKWEYCIACLFQLTAGTRQGGLMSPALFAVFINDVIVKLEVSGLGCFIHNVCFNQLIPIEHL